MMAHTGISSAYVWFNGFMGLVLGVLGGIFILGIFTKRANLKGAYAAMIASSIVLLVIKYALPAEAVSIWAYSLISIVVSLVVGYVVSVLTGGKAAPENTTVYDIASIHADKSWEVRH